MSAVAAPPAASQTVLDVLVERLRGAATYNKQDQTPPAAVLWPDKERLWQPLVPRLREQLPIYALGDYRPEERSGPAYWLRCISDPTLPESAPADGETPILYLPGVSRQDIRAVETCPRELQPLAELQYRGVLWTQKNGRDWTIAAFLQTADGGLGLSVATDNATREALNTALVKLADEPIDGLRQEGQLRAPFLSGLLHPDEVKHVLRWLDDPSGFRSHCDSAEWTAFHTLLKVKYDVDPERDGPLPGARRLAQREGNWDLVWRRFAESPKAYSALPDLLRRARPKNISPLFEAGAYPQDNEKAETELRQALLKLEGSAFADAAQQVQELEQAHAPRREWVWHALGQSPLAAALADLAELATSAATSLVGKLGHTPRDVIEGYTTTGWRVDAAVLSALVKVESQADVGAIRVAIRALYTDWLRGSATLMQGPLPKHVPAEYAAVAGPQLSAGTCMLFSDGLRYDLAQALSERLRQRGLTAEVAWRMTALPSITATAKPAVTPAAERLSSGPGLEPTYAGTKVTAQVLRKALNDAGHQVLLGDDCGDPAGTAWTELGDIDAYGHEHGWKIAHQVDGELRGLRERIEALLDHGWRQVVVVTDHGWLLLPGGLPKFDLPEHLTEVRKGRCARLKPTSTTSAVTVGWRWDPNVTFAFAPGIDCFELGKEYEHGGISPQECITPVLTASLAAAATTTSIRSVAWRGMRCIVALDGAAPNLRVDLRAKTADPESSLVIGGAKPVTPDGTVSLPVSDDHEGAAAAVVIVNDQGTVVGYTSTTVGG
jgi:hypothetical protein